MPQPENILGAIARLRLADDRALAIAPGRKCTANDLAQAKSDRGGAGATVALCFRDPLALLEKIATLDGRCAAMLLLSAELSVTQIEQLVTQVGATQLETDRSDLGSIQLLPEGESGQAEPMRTRWLLTTSGTTGEPKVVAHDFPSLSRSIRPRSDGREARWGLLYEPSRFAALQVMLQALLNGCPLLLPDPAAEFAERIEWLAAQRCTHLSATPALWRRILMSPCCTRLPLTQITLGGEIADEAILSALRATFPEARITHVYASTEVGVGFSVQDGKSGFPARWLESGAPSAMLAVRDGILWLHPRESTASAASAAHIERDKDGFVCTRDSVKVEGERVYFTGRDDASINVGGIKVQAEQVEAIIHANPGVAHCHVSARHSAMMGNVLHLAVVPRGPAVDKAQFRRDIAQWCKERLPRHARPASIEVIDEIAVSTAGKLLRGAGA
jgi:acyl-CoA synthetase (AMP-forming)/AMP-acid ligase II